MKTILTAIVVAVFVVFSSLCFASYVIHLKSGHSFQTDRYWEEGGEIKFKRYGGVVGVRKDLVQDIEEIEDLPEETEAAKPETPSATDKADDVKKAEIPEAVENAGGSEDVVVKEEGTGDKSEQEKATREGKKKTEKEEKKTDVARYKKEKKVLTDNYRKARQGLREARKAKDKPGIIVAKQQIKDAEKEMAALVRNLKKESGGLIPPWGFESEREEQVEAPEGR